MNILSKIAPFLLLGNLLMATTITTKNKEVNDKFCTKVPKKDYEFCMEIKSEYPIISSRDKILQKNMNKAIKKELFKKGDAQKYVLENLEDMGSMGHEESLSIDILSRFPKSFTLEVSSYSYLGGAHGLGVVQLFDYDAKTGKRIKTEELFVKNYKKKLKGIAEKKYRTQHHLKSTDSLSDKEGWFKDTFTLPDVIGMGEDGLHLEYGSYEVQSYASGTISLLLEYELLKEIINPNSYLASMLKKKKLVMNKSRTYVLEDKNFYIKVKAKKIASDKIELTVNAETNNGNLDKKGGLSLSFPQLTKKSDVIKKSRKGFSKLSVYSSNSSVYHFKKKKSIKSEYLLIEGETKKWSSEKSKIVKILLKIPKESDTFIINLRATMVDDKKIVKTPFDGVIGQQGSYNYQLKLNL